MMESVTNKLILGTAQFGMQYGINNNSNLTKSDVFSIFDFALDIGIKILDTAEVYGNAHQIISEFHSLSSKKFEVITKFSSLNNISYLDKIEQNLRLLKVDHFYSYLFHRFDNFLDLLKNNRALLDEIVNNKSIKKIGVSVYDNFEIDQLIETKLVEIIQFPFNALDNFNLRCRVLESMKNNGIEIHSRSVFLQGLFFKESDELRGNLTGLKFELEALKDICSKFNCTMRELALNYVLHNPEIDKILIGVDCLSQLKENVKSINLNFDKKIFDEINKIHLSKINLLNPSNWSL